MEPEDINDERLYKVIEDISLTGTNEIRARLKTNEHKFHQFGRVLNQRGRDFLLYAVLDEIERAGLAILRCRDDLEKNQDFFKTTDDAGKRVARNLLQTIHDEISLYIRRLTEVFTNLINFSQTNTNPYYDHYLTYTELDQYKKRKEDLRFYFNCENKNTEEAIKLFKFSITEAEKHIDLAKCWYLQKDKQTGTPKAGGEAKLNDFQQRLTFALNVASKDERIILGGDYERAYRASSRSIHLNIGGKQLPVTLQLIRLRQIQTMFLMTYCLFRCRRLLRIRSAQGLVATLMRKPIAQTLKSKPYYKFTSPNISKGDFVIVHGYLAEVIGSRKSRFGYKSFHIRYLAKAPMDEGKDWVPAPDIQLLSKGAKVRQEVRALLLSHGAIPPNPKFIARKVRETVLELWQTLTQKQ